MQKLIITISKTADGQQDYMQIVSEDQFAINVVLISPGDHCQRRQADGRRGGGRR